MYGESSRKSGIHWIGAFVEVLSNANSKLFTIAFKVILGENVKH